MDELQKKIIADNKAVLSLIKTCVTTPTLINTDITQGAKYAVPLMCETNQMSASAEVSESLVISSEAKKNITDNIAPGSKSWNLSGYITGLDSVGRGDLEYPTNKYQPIVKFHVDMIWAWFNAGAVLVFKDGNARIFKRVVIKDLQTSQVKDAANAMAFSMTLKEINVMETSLSDLPDNDHLSANKIKNSIPTVGSEGGMSKSLGATVTKKVDADQVKNWINTIQSSQLAG